MKRLEMLVIMLGGVIQGFWSLLGCSGQNVTIFHRKESFLVASWLVCSTTEQAVWVQALTVDIVLCSWARHLTLTVRHLTLSLSRYNNSCW